MKKPHSFAALGLLVLASFLSCSDASSGAGNASTDSEESDLLRGGGFVGGGGVPGASGNGLAGAGEGGLTGEPLGQDPVAGDARIENGADGQGAQPEEDSENAPDTATGEEQDTVPFAYECDLGDTEECVTQCGSIGIRTCSKVWGPCVPPEEVCNGEDDDCDGFVDNGLAEALEPELCDGLDNDCDGLTDEDLFEDCPCDVPGVPGNVCQNGEWTGCPAILTESTGVEMPALAPNCPWGVGDNLPEKSGAFAARVEQTVPLSLVPGARLCSFSMAGNSPDFYFDDHIMLLFNGIPLIGSFHFTNAFAPVEGLPVYDWAQIVGQFPGDFGQNTHCLAGHTECSMPGTQSNGEVSVAFDEATNALLANTGEGGTHAFTIVVTGDNDPPVDCHHTGLSMLIDYTYVIAP